MATTTVEIVWLKNLFQNMRVQLIGTSQLYCDNNGAIYITSNHTSHEMMKHIEIDCPYVREEC